MRISKITGKIIMLGSIMSLTILSGINLSRNKINYEDLQPVGSMQSVAASNIQNDSKTSSDNNESKDKVSDLKKETIKGLDNVKEKASFKIKLPKTLIDDLKEESTYLDVFNNEYLKDHNVVTTFYSGPGDKSIILTQMEYTKTLDEVGDQGDKIKAGNLDVILQSFAPNDKLLGASFVLDNKYYQVQCKNINRQKLIKFIEDFSNQ